MKKTLLTILVLSMFVTFGSITAKAQTETSSTLSLEQQVASLTARIAALQEIIRNKNVSIAGLRYELNLARTLTQGSTGDDVKQLQQFLAEDSAIYPEKLITGYFGPATEAAIKRFQKKNGIDSLGVVGPKTRAIIREKSLRNATLSPVSPLSPSSLNPTLSPVSPMMPSGLNPTLSPLSPMTPTTPTAGGTSTGQITICHIPPGNTSNAHTITIGIPALQAHLAHGDTIGACAGTTTPDITPPIISGLMATTTTNSETKISWTTNEAADGTIWYGTSNPLVINSSTQKVSFPALITNHLYPISGLTANTTYYFIVASKDAALNNATSSQMSFVTLP